jgi:hypothetical protein
MVIFAESIINTFVPGERSFQFVTLISSLGADERPSCMGRYSNVKQETPGQGDRDCRYLFTIILVYSCPTY